MSTYHLYLDGSATDFETDGRSPAKALLALCEEAGLALASQDGRYGRLVDGRSVSALTGTWSRRKLDPLERTTRLGGTSRA